MCALINAYHIVCVYSVDKDSLAEDQGLLVGDQILMVNGISFRNILHEEAVSVLKTNDVLMMSVQVYHCIVSSVFINTSVVI